MTLDRKAFLNRFNLTEDQFSSAAISWEVLEEIHKRHISASGDLQTTANYLAEKLRQVPSVHSLKQRVKDPEHLIEKVIRKRIENPQLDITPENYGERLTDLIGIRALHLFKNEWSNIHDFIDSTWELHEPAVANVRAGDSQDLQQGFLDRGCLVKEHPFGYRSVHYLVKLNPTKALYIAEVQVRTIFEEGWSEIDHQIRYPYDQDNPILGQLLVIFNRLAGSADEMALFIRFLRDQLAQRESSYASARSTHEREVAELQSRIEELTINRKEKDDLERRVSELSSRVRPLQPSAAEIMTSLSHLSPSPTLDLIRDLNLKTSFASPLSDFFLSYYRTANEAPIPPGAKRPTAQSVRSTGRVTSERNPPSATSAPEGEGADAAAELHSHPGTRKLVADKSPSSKRPARKRNKR